MNYKIEEVVIDKIVDGIEGEETTVYRVYEDGTKEFGCSHWKPKPSDEAVDPSDVPDPIMEKLDSIEAKIQTNEDLQKFYDDIVKEVGL